MFNILLDCGTVQTFWYFCFSFLLRLVFGRLCWSISAYYVDLLLIGCFKFDLRRVTILNNVKHE
jgi:hypothetical protein